MKGFRIIQSGFSTTIQDLGRFGFQKYGISVGGAMDSYALRIGNRLLNDEEGEAGIEVTMPGLVVEA